MSTTTSFGPGSGMMMSSSSAGCFSLRATTPLTVQDMLASFEVEVLHQPIHDQPDPSAPRGVPRSAAVDPPSTPDDDAVRAGGRARHEVRRAQAGRRARSGAGPPRMARGARAPAGAPPLPPDES